MLASGIKKFCYRVVAASMVSVLVQVKSGMKHRFESSCGLADRFIWADLRPVIGFQTETVLKDMEAESQVEV